MMWAPFGRQRTACHIISFYNSMMNKRQILSIAALAAAAGAFAADTDPVLMTVDGKDVHVSEFEYLYNKNNTQQAQPQSLDDYMDLFVNYKLKVADALRDNLDKTPEFTTEYQSFVKDLAKPYLRDAKVAEELVQQAYAHYLKDVTVSHIMLAPQPGNDTKLDSIRNAIVSGKTTFEDAARANSIDSYSARNGGLMGHVTPGRLPWAFEEASYDTKPGDISPVINSGFGYHIIRVEKSVPASGDVEAEHILLLTRDLDEQAAAAQKVKIDSIYEALKAGADFADMARRFSQDPGSARNGGKLGRFGRGMMVPEFDSTAFALADGEMSKPFTTSFGWHIVRRTGHHDVGSLDELRPAIEAAIANDVRSTMPEKAVKERLRIRYNARVLQQGLDDVAAVITANGGQCDSAAIAQIKVANPVVGVYDGGEVTAVDAIGRVPDIQMSAGPMSAITSAANDILDDIIVEKYQQNLAAEDDDFRNLLNEYHDGILLYEVSNRKVWDKASKDTEGLENYFRKNAAKYRWDAPKFKGYVIFADKDSILAEALAYADSIPSDNSAEFVAAMREHFKRAIKIERVVAAKGENPITDYLGFGAERPASTPSNRWNFYASYKGRVVDAPEEAADVRGQALTDYQETLDKAWLKDLHKKYKVKINKKVFKSLKDKK